MNLSAAIKDIENGRHPGIGAAHEVRRAADVAINLARLEAAMLAKAITDGNVDEAQRLVRSLIPQVFGRSAMLVRVVQPGGES